jgi:BCD family chlorophyll transporter-like MFS transporter
MQDVLIEPYGGLVLHLAVGATTYLTATMALGGLFGFGLASVVLARGADPYRMAAAGAWVGIPAFAAVIASAPLQSSLLFAAGVFGIGFGVGLFGHGTLTATMNRAPREQTGLALGAWGAVQATAAGVGVAAGGILRDALGGIAAPQLFGTAFAGPAFGFVAVYTLEIMLLAAALLVMDRLIERPVRLAHPHPLPTDWR